MARPHQSSPSRIFRSEQPNFTKISRMQIFVGSTAYEVDSATSVKSLKLMIENAEFVPSHQILLMNGADVLGEGSLEANGVEDDDALEMRLAVPAGMRKKWKKKRSKYQPKSSMMKGMLFFRCGLLRLYDSCYYSASSSQKAQEDASTRPLSKRFCGWSEGGLRRGDWIAIPPCLERRTVEIYINVFRSGVC